MIIDASVALKWFFAEADSDRALALLGAERLAAPSLIHAEVGNAVWKKHRRGELVGDIASIDLGLLDQVLAITHDRELVENALQFAMVLAHPIYDCFYLSLAERLGEALVTADVKFARKVGAAAVDVRVELLA